MPLNALTRKQRRLRTEIEEIASFIAMDHWNILDYSPESRTTYLEKMKVQLVRSEIITKYTLIDEFLAVIICHYYFKQPKSAPTFSSLWRTKRFQIFNHHVLDESYLLNKMRLVRAIKEMPSDVRSAIERINAVRNAIAHSFFPENRKQYRSEKKVMYQGEEIYTIAGMKKFYADFELARDYLWRRTGWA